MELGVCARISWGLPLLVCVPLPHSVLETERVGRSPASELPVSTGP